MTDPVIVTRNLALRWLRPNDRELIYRHLNNEDVLRFLGGQRMTFMEHNDFFDWLCFQQRRHGFTFWPVERRADDEFLGLCGLVVVDEGDSTVFGCVEIGWRFRMDLARHGAAEEAARACLNYATQIARVSRVVSRTTEANLPSKSLMKRIGLQPDRSLDYKTEAGEKLIVYRTIPAEDPARSISSPK